MQIYNHKNETKMEIIPLNKMQSNLFVTEMNGQKIYDYYLTGEITEPDEYLDLCHALRTADEDDYFIIRINSYGGSVHTGNQIINAIKDSPANVLGYIEGICGSMATFIFLACSQWGVSDNAEWFSHTMSYGNFGKESEAFQYSEFMRKQTHKRINRDYANFLTEVEIASIIEGKDLYMDSEEIKQRLEKYAESFGEGEELEDIPTLDKIVQDAVQSGIKQMLEELNVVSPKNAAKKAATKRATKTTKVVDKKEGEVV